MWHRKQIPATAFEKLRIAAMMKGGCALSLYRKELGLAVPTRGKVECHHVVRNTKRLGHWYTLPLNVWYHQRIVPYPMEDQYQARELYGASLKDSMRVFRASHGLDDLELWVWLQGRLGMSAELPASKIYKAPLSRSKGSLLMAAAPIPVSLQLEEAMRLGIIKILSNVVVNERGCWVWQKWCNPRWGYGHVAWRGSDHAVHRLLWQLMKGPIPDGKLLCHSCDNPPCCNPDHLWIGTDQQNHIDKTKKGRHHYDPAVKTHCKQGHEFTPENTRMSPVEGRPGLYRRQCKTCTKLGHQKPAFIAWRRDYQRKRRAQKRAERLAGEPTEVQA